MKTSIAKPLLTAILMAVALTACKDNFRVGFGGGDDIEGSGIEGSGIEGHRQQDLPTFEAIEVRGSVQLDIATGAAGPLDLQTDDNLLEIITTEVVNGVLIIGASESFSTSLGVKIAVTTPRLTRLAITGSCSVTAQALASERLEITASGAAKITLQGSVDHLDIQVAGAVSVQAQDLIARAAKIQASGAGTLSVHAQESLDIKMGGIGTVTYKGDPKVTQKISGLATVTKQ